MKSWVIACFAASAVAIGCAHNKNSEEGEEKDEVKLTLDQVPAAARAGLQREAGGATISKVDQETSHGQTVYETDVMTGGKNWEIKVDANGNLVSKKIEDEAAEKAEKSEKKGKEEKEDKD
jgi:uncharacterized membrane protein YkoI